MKFIVSQLHWPFDNDNNGQDPYRKIVIGIIIIALVMIISFAAYNFLK